MGNQLHSVGSAHKWRNAAISLVACLGVVLAISVMVSLASRPNSEANLVSASDSSPPRLTTVNERSLVKHGIELASPASAVPAFTRQQAEALALSRNGGGTVRESVLARFSKINLRIPPGTGDVWLVSVAPLGGYGKSAVDDFPFTFLVEVFDAKTGAYIGTFEGA